MGDRGPQIMRAQCPHCTKTYVREGSLRSHLQGVHGYPHGHEKCQICAKVFLNKRYKDLHERNHHHHHAGGRPTDSDDHDTGRSSSSSLPVVGHRCLHCVKKFSSLHFLNLHVTSRHKDRMEDHDCNYCGASFSTKSYLQQHIHRKHQPQFFTKKKQLIFCCEFCAKIFSNHLYLEQHIILSHRCHFCNSHFTTKTALVQHRQLHERSHRSRVQLGANSNIIINQGPFTVVRAFKGYLSSYRVELSKERAMEIGLNSVEGIWEYYKQGAARILKDSIAKYSNIKVQFSALVEYKRKTGEDSWEYREYYMNSYAKIILHENAVQRVYSEIEQDISVQVSKFEKFGSGWTCNVVRGIDIRVNKYSPIAPTCFVKVPRDVYLKHCVVNVQNRDHQCFKWAVLSVLHPTANHSERVSSYKKYEHEYMWNEAEFPMKLNRITTFESSNNIAVNVFTWDCEDKLIPLQMSLFNYKKNFTTVNLLLVKGAQNNWHYCGIKDVHRLLGKTNCARRQLCYNCLHTFNGKTELTSHYQKCKTFDTKKVELPQEANGKPPILEFYNFKNKLKAGFVAVADFECILQSTGETEKHTKHTPCGMAYVIIRDDGKVVDQMVYRGDECVDIFLERMDHWGNYVQEIRHQIAPMIVTKENMKSFKDATFCHICELPFKDNETKVIDHCHRTGLYRGAAHGAPCNINYKQQKKLPVILHNMKNYDGHLIVRGFRKYHGSSKIYILPNSSEKYMSIICDSFYIIDSCQFMQSSLSSLLDDLKKSCNGSKALEREKFDIFYQTVKIPRHVNLLLRKGVFPYDYLDSFDVFTEKSLPSRSKFFNRLTNTDCSIKDYKHALNVFKVFKCKNIGDFHDIYLLGDVLQLACVFENFRSFCLKFHKLDSVHYFSLPGFAWDSALLRTRVKLELLTDIDKYMNIEAGMRGGISMIGKRYAKAENHYIGGENNGNANKFLLFLDMNNLYGTAMATYSLPVSDFEWETDLESFNLSDYDDNGDKGAIVTCDLDYPPELHDLHNQYPLCPDHIEIPLSDLSNFQRGLLENFSEISGESVKYDGKQKKLIAHFGPRRNIVLHIENLKFYLAQGMKLRAIHKVLKFTQKPWLKEFVEFCTEMRVNAANKFESNLHKLTVNSTFGKTGENKRKRVSIKLANDLEKCIKYASKATMKKWEILDQGLVYFVMDQKKVFLDKPIYVAFSILELSKLLMYKFHYEKMMKYYSPDKICLLFTDTDSLCYEIQTEDIYADMKKNLSDYDTSDYPPTHFLYSALNKKVLGKLKDEFNGQVPLEYAGLSSKMYSMIAASMRKKACKGTQRAVIENELQHKVYLKYLFNQQRLKCKMTSIRSFNHNIVTMTSEKVSLHAFDSKRFILDDGIDTLAWYHYRIASFNNCWEV